MKSMVEGECGQSNALVNLAQNYGTSNQRIAPSVSRGANALFPSSSLGEQFANDFLIQKGASAAMPTTFNMNALSTELNKTSNLASKWSNEFVTSPKQQLVSQWSQQYMASHPVYESAWAYHSGQELPYQQRSQSSSSIDSSMWSSEFLDNIDTSLQTSQVHPHSLADAWSEEFTNQQLQKDMAVEWETIQRNVALAQGDDISRAKDDIYVHQVENQYLALNDPLSEGDSLMQAGDLGNAMLAYEAAVQKNPQDANAWCKLGLSHAENEHDTKAIAAFNNCLKIQPDNQEALLALSVSLANESLENDSLNQLERWLIVHQGGDPTKVKNRAVGYSSFLDHAAFKRVEDQFLSAARQQVGTADAGLQNALGVLYNLNRNFDRAVDCIRLAIANQPDDPRLWNRLGATLANGDKTVEAISAYREAINKYPSYVRARYNLGISCMHLNSYREAVEHFVSALDLQKGSSDGSSIWPTLRSASIRLPHTSENLLQAINNRDLPALKEALKTTFTQS